MMAAVDPPAPLFSPEWMRWVEAEQRLQSELTPAQIAAVAEWIDAKAELSQALRTPKSKPFIAVRKAHAAELMAIAQHLEKNTPPGSQ